MTGEQVEEVCREFEGLVKETASQIARSGVELEFDDIRQFLRIKVWRAVRRFDPDRAAAAPHLSHARDRHGRSPLQRYVFMCVANERKDLEKRVKRRTLSVDALRDDETSHGSTAPNDTQRRADKFDARYLSVTQEDVYGEIEQHPDELPPELERLTVIERQVVLLRLQGKMLSEIDRELGLSRAQRERVLQSVREKLADLLPESARRTGPMRPLPGVAPRQTLARVLQAA